MNICLEYVSANPNGPITIQHARAAVVGDILARVFAEAGHSVTREFYVNDAPGTTLTAFVRSVAAEAAPFAAKIARSARGATLSDILAAVRACQSASLAELGVTFDDVWVPHENLIGTEGEGWKQVGAELAFERSGPERIYSSIVLLEQWISVLRQRADRNSHAVTLGQLTAHLATLRNMSITVTAPPSPSCGAAWPTICASTSTNT